jgi:hypothetical protein
MVAFDPDIAVLGEFLITQQSSAQTLNLASLYSVARYATLTVSNENMPA